MITTAGRMVAKHVIHTAGPVYGKGGKDKEQQLGDCYRSALSLAVEKGARSIAFPAISTGVYGYPPEEAAQVASQAIEKFLKSNSFIQEVRLVFFSQKDADIFLKHHVF